MLFKRDLRERVKRMDCYLAHSATEKKPDGQRLKEHLENVAKLCAEFSLSFGKEDGRLCGLFHDIGKYSDSFQRRINGSQEQVDHSSAGAMLMFQSRNLPASMCIAGHHAGLADCGTKNDLSETFMAKINRAKAGEIEDFSAWRKEIQTTIPVGGENRPGLGNYFYTKMLFSALTDADWLDTEAYFKDSPVELPVCDLKELINRLDRFVSEWKDPQKEIDQLREQIRKSAIRHAEDAPGLFSMTVPTGGGKTISSMSFALHHAKQHGLRRIIYVIPYCSILEQTQSVFEKIFGKEFITAHYSGATFERTEDEDTRAFSADNWSAPIILTTAVQFFESIYSDRPGKNRKLHNIAQSVIIFDEAQMLPIPFLRPCLAAICELVKDYSCSSVLCTATQPAIEPLVLEFLPGSSMRELCPEREKMYQAFRRVTYIDEGELTDEQLAERLQAHDQVLCIVNSRRQAQKLFDAIRRSEGSFHLSTMMTAHDRRSALAIIRERLKSGRPCRVISTSLIEAGVDVDFPTVYRALAGLDSVIQAGGRCNREGKRSTDKSIVHIFRTQAKAPRMLDQNISAAVRALRDHDIPDAPETIRDYFHFLFYVLKNEEQLDEKAILADAKRLRFRTIAEHFRMIDGAGYTIYIPTGEGAQLVDQLRRFGPSRSLMRKLGEYSVSVYRSYFDRLCETGVLERLTADAGILLDQSLYSAATGLPFDLSEQDQGIFI